MARDTRVRIVETTAQLLQHRGYHGTSLSDILTESGAPRGSLYFHFPGGKDQLVMEATRKSVEETTRWLERILGSAKSPVAAVRAYAEGAASALQESDYTFGCPVAPLILDATASFKELAELCKQAFEEWLGLLQEAFVKAGLSVRRAYPLAVLVEASIEGAMVIARTYRDPGPLLSLAAQLEAVVRAALPQRQRN
jgi:TetR/AcrR family transcriptional repressor of lmrAB and yxaGH operons